jgi:hypothetical protein
MFQATGRRLLGLGDADGLMYGHDTPVEQARTGKLFDIADEARAQARQRIEAADYEQIETRIDALGMYEFRILDVAIEPEAIGGAFRHRDALSFYIDIIDALDRRACGGTR